MSGASIARTTANRAVHLRVTPRPSNLAESREILRLISQFGEVEYFKNLKYDALSLPGTSIAIFKDPDAAVTCLRKSPIRFRMGQALNGREQNNRSDRIERRDQPNEYRTEERAGVQSWPDTQAHSSTSPFGLAQRRPFTTSAASQSPADSPEPPPSPAPHSHPDSRIFQIQTNAAKIKFQDRVAVGHYHGTFAIDSRSIAQKILVQTVPIRGLSCVNWKAEDKPWRLVQKQKKETPDGEGKPKKLREIYERAMKRGKSGNPV